MPERFVGIDVALRDHRVAVLDREGEAVGKSFTATATKDGFTTLLQTLQARGATPAQSLVGLEATGHLWENLEAALVGAGYRVIVLNRSAEWRTIYLRKRAQGKKAKQALIVVAVKLLHTVYAMLKHRRPYNPSRLLVAPATTSHGMSPAALGGPSASALSRVVAQARRGNVPGSTIFLLPA